MSDKKKNIYEKIVSIMDRVNTVIKGETVGYGNNAYSAVSHDDVTRLLHKEFVTEKLVAIPTMLECKNSEITMKGKKGDYQAFSSEVKAMLTIINAEAPGEKIESVSTGFSFDTQDKAVGKAYSYSIKYALLKVFMLESLDHEEQRIRDKQDSQPQKPQQPQKPKSDAYSQLVELIKNKIGAGADRESILNFLGVKAPSELTAWEDASLIEAGGTIREKF